MGKNLWITIVGNCSTCMHAILCPTFGDYKCLVRKIRMQKPEEGCSHYKKGKVSNNCHCAACEKRGCLFYDDILPTIEELKEKGEL